MDQPENPNPADEHSSDQPLPITRRGFLQRLGALMAFAGIGTAANSCAPLPASTAPAPTPVFTPIPPELKYPDVPPPPAITPPSGVLRVFTAHEAQTVEAITARIFPGTPDDPGAREAGVITYIDNLLSLREGFWESTYREPPYVELYEGDIVPDPSDSGQFQVIYVPAAEIERYGYQSVLTPREVYRLGIAALDEYTKSKFGRTFIQLTEDQQDEIVGDLADNKAGQFFKQFSSEAFFNVLRRHTSEGMFSDPAYGGNRDMVGWKLLGYPGAQRVYTPDEIRVEGTIRQPQAQADLPHAHPGQPAGPHVVLPVSGSDHQGHQYGPKKDPFWPIESR